MTEPSGDLADEDASVHSEPAPPAPDVFGDLLPDQTRDEQAGGDWRDLEDDHDERLRREVPPHH